MAKRRSVQQRLELKLFPEQLELLRVLGDPAVVLARLADHACQGITRPGAWERAWLEKAFGSFDDLEPAPEPTP